MTNQQGKQTNEQIADKIVQKTRFDDEITECRNLIKQALDAKDATIERLIKLAPVGSDGDAITQEDYDSLQAELSTAQLLIRVLTEN